MKHRAFDDVTAEFIACTCARRTVAAALQHLIETRVYCRSFISGFAHRLNQLSLAKMAVTVSREFSSPEDAANFLQEVRRHTRTQMPSPCA